MKNKIFIITILLISLSLTACKVKNVEDTAAPGIIENDVLSEVDGNTDSGEQNETPENKNTDTTPTDNETGTSDEDDPEDWEDEGEVDILTKLKKEYPDATITEENGKYSVISDNIDFTAVKEKQQHGISDRRIYESMDELLGDLDPLKDAVFIGEKTGETRQFIPVNEKGLLNGLYYTDSKVKVTKVFYGDVSEGDIITLSEFYAVFGSGEKAKVIYSDISPISIDECLYTVAISQKKSLFGDDCYYYPLPEGCFRIGIVKANIENGVELKARSDFVAKDLYNKYIVNGDTALDKEEEIAKAQKWVGETALTNDQLAKIDELCKKYGEVKK